MQHSFFYTLEVYLLPCFIILIALSVIIRRKPLIINNRVLTLIISLVIVPPIIEMFYNSTDSFVLAFLAMMMLFFVLTYYFMRGYVVLGADVDSFQRAFITTLTEGNFEYEQTFTSIKIKEPALTISVIFRQWTGSGQIRLSSKGNKETFDKIVNDIKAKDIKTNLRTPVIYLIAGMLLLFREYMRF